MWSAYERQNCNKFNIHHTIHHEHFSPQRKPRFYLNHSWPNINTDDTNSKFTLNNVSMLIDSNFIYRVDSYSKFIYLFIRAINFLAQLLIISILNSSNNHRRHHSHMISNNFATHFHFHLTNRYQKHTNYSHWPSWSQIKIHKFV